MAATSLYPARVTRSFDKLTAIVCSGNREAVKDVVTRLRSAGKIDGQEGGLILQVHQMFEHGLDDAAFSSWGAYVTAAMDAANNRMFHFLEWADSIAETSYRTGPACCQ